MRISIFTATNNTSFLAQAYDSIKDQDFYEWIVVYNNGAFPVDFSDKRVRGFQLGNVLDWVGPLKAYGCEQATGDVLLEFDHDDVLMPNAVEEVKRAFEDPEVGFAYSNTIRCGPQFQKVERFSEKIGFRYRDVTWKGHEIEECVGFPPSPHSISRIWFAPDHLRAFRKSVYDQIGGYSKRMRVLDDLDLMCRMYCATKFAYIDKGLYVYRIHGENTWLQPERNKEIQDNVLRIHDMYFDAMTEKWARDRGLRLAELGGRLVKRAGFTSVDLFDCDVRADLNEEWPFPDGEVGVVRSFDTFEHLRDPVHTIKELYRILAPGGYAIIQVPSTDGRGAFQDPSHVSFWNQNSFLYYTDHRWNQYLADCPVRFQAVRLYTTQHDERGVCWTVAHLVKLGADRVPGEVTI